LRFGVFVAEIVFCVQKTPLTQHPENKLKVLFAFFCIYFIWGTTYLAAIIGLETLPPFLLSGLRFVSAGLVFVIVCAVKKMEFPKGKNLLFTALSGVVMLVGGSALVTWSEQYILSGHAAVVVASEPFFFVLLDRQRWRYYFSNRNIIAGLLTGFLGVMLFVSFSSASEVQSATAQMVFIGYTVLFLSCLLWVTGSIFSSRNKEKGTSTVVVSAIQLMSAGVFSLLLAWATNEFEGFSFAEVSLRSWGGFIYLSVGGSILAYFSFIWLLTVRSPAQVSTHTYINPVIALFMGWWIAGDPVNFQQLLSVGVILAGVLLTNRGNPDEGIF
jgi:drug/metabolite transporter (DMT)-like permease